MLKEHKTALPQNISFCGSLVLCVILLYYFTLTTQLAVFPSQAGTSGGNAGTQTTPSSNNNASNTTNSNTTSNAATGKVATGDATATALLMALLMAAGGTVVFARKRIYDK